MQQNNYVSLINSVTHLSGNINGGSCIDHTFFKSDYSVKSSKLLDQITYHMSLFISFTAKTETKYKNINNFKINKTMFLTNCNKEP